MNQLLKTNCKLSLTNLQTHCEVDYIIGSGAQGEVYKVDLDRKSLALKWYLPRAATNKQRDILKTLIDKGPPASSFLWPILFAESPNIPGFGYFMPLRDKRFKSLTNLMKRRIDPSFQILCLTGANLAHNFLQLHSKGLCYRDISFGNIFLDPNTAEIQICDNDNVTEDDQSQGGILGTPRFMAPELVRREARPSSQTDLFSLSVLLFYLLLLHHPLEGKKELSIKCLDLPAMNRLYGKEPLFIFDPTDSSNEPVSGHHDNALIFWPIYPKFLRDLFIQAFGEGLVDPTSRVRESEWRSALTLLSDSIFYCSNCESENFYDSDFLKTNQGSAGTCWSCKNTLSLPPRIKIENKIIMLNKNSKLFPYHIDDSKPCDFSSPIGERTVNSSDLEQPAIKNSSTEKWVSSLPGETPQDILPGEKLNLVTGTKVYFGKKKGIIRV